MIIPNHCPHDEDLTELPDWALQDLQEFESTLQEAYRLADKLALRADRLKHTAGRNDTCPCGSGRKFKKCCGDIRRQQESEKASVFRGRLLHLMETCHTKFNETFRRGRVPALKAWEMLAASGLFNFR